MSMKTIVIGSDQYIFFNQSWRRGYSWGHKSILHKNGAEIEYNRVTYINRTWEQYTFQTCMKGLVYKLIAETEDRYIRNYKANNGIKRLATVKREELEKQCKIDYPDFYELLSKL